MSKVKRAAREARRSRKARWLGVFTMLAASFVFLVTAGSVLASHSDGNFEIDTNANLDDDSAIAGKDDWKSVITATRNANETPNATTGSTCTQSAGAGFLFCDPVKSDPTTHEGGDKEETPSDWVIQPNQVTPKTDITNIYALARIVGGNPVLVNGFERLPKAGSVHLNFEFNQSVTGNIPNRQVGDLLIAYDLGGSRNSNEGAMRIRVFKAKAGFGEGGGAGYDFANPDVDLSASSFPITDHASGITASMNAVGAVSAGSWQSYDDHYALVNTIDRFGFAEASIDLGALGLSNICINNITVRSRASEGSVSAQLKDTTRPQAFPFCRAMKVVKYIDADESGTKNTGDVLSGDDVTGWSFTVKNPAGNTICTGTTNASGELVCSTGSLSQLGPGDYTVIENTPLKTITSSNRATFNSDPGPIPKTATIQKVVSVSLAADTTVEFGNTCFIDKTFELTNVPSPAPAGLFVFYKKEAGPGSTGASEQKVNLTQVGTTSTYRATVGSFTMANSISWGWGTNRDDITPANEQRVVVKTSASPESFSTAGYPGCAKTNTAHFDRATLNGTKFKDVNGDGTRQPLGANGAAGGDDDETLMQGWEFKLYSGSFPSSAPSGTALQTQRSNASGAYSFTGVAPGTYTVVETQVTGWLQTAPTSGSNRVVTVGLADLGSSKTIDAFGNTPLSKIEVKFLPQAKLLNLDGTASTTDATKATSINCGTAGGSTTNAGGVPSHTTGNLQLNQSTITCVVTFVDP